MIPMNYSPTINDDLKKAVVTAVISAIDALSYTGKINTDIRRDLVSYFDNNELMHALAAKISDILSPEFGIRFPVAKINELAKRCVEEHAYNLIQKQQTQSIFSRQSSIFDSTPKVQFNTNNQNSGYQIGEISMIKETPAASAQKKTVLADDKPIEGSKGIFVAYTPTTEVSNPLEKFNVVDTKKLSNFGLPNIIEATKIVEYKHTQNGAKYTFMAFDYKVPEESVDRITSNFLKFIMSKMSSGSKFMAHVKYTEFFLIHDADYNTIKKDFEDVKKSNQSKGYKEAIKKLNNKAFIFSSLMKEMIIRDINELVHLFIRTNEEVGSTYVIDDFDDIDELMNLNRSSGVPSALMIDDFDGFIINIVTEVFNKYFGRESHLFSIDNDDIYQILSHPDVVIRNENFTERDFHKIKEDAGLKAEFMNAVSSFAMFGFTNNAIITNIVPTSVDEALQEHHTYITKIPNSAFESLLFEHATDNKQYAIEIIGAEKKKLRLGRTLERSLILKKK